MSFFQPGEISNSAGQPGDAPQQVNNTDGETMAPPRRTSTHQEFKVHLAPPSSAQWRAMTRGDGDGEDDDEDHEPPSIALVEEIPQDGNPESGDGGRRRMFMAYVARKVVSDIRTLSPEKLQGLREKYGKRFLVVNSLATETSAENGRRKRDCSTVPDLRPMKKPRLHTDSREGIAQTGSNHEFVTVHDSSLDDIAQSPSEEEDSGIGMESEASTRTECPPPESPPHDNPGQTTPLNGNSSDPSPPSIPENTPSSSLDSPPDSNTPAEERMNENITHDDATDDDVLIKMILVVKQSEGNTSNNGGTIIQKAEGHAKRRDVEQLIHSAKLTKCVTRKSQGKMSDMIEERSTFSAIDAATQTEEREFEGNPNEDLTEPEPHLNWIHLDDIVDERAPQVNADEETETGTIPPMVRRWETLGNSFRNNASTNCWQLRNETPAECWIDDTSVELGSSASTQIPRQVVQPTPSEASSVQQQSFLSGVSISRFTNYLRSFVTRNDAAASASEEEIEIVLPSETKIIIKKRSLR